MHKHAPAAQSLMAVYAALAATILWLSVSRSHLDAGELPRFLVLFVLAAMALRYPTKLARSQGSFSLCNVFVFAGILLMPLPLSLLLCVFTWSSTLPQRNRKGETDYWVTPLVNAAQLVIATAAAGWVLSLTGAAQMRSIGDVLWVSASALIFVAIQTLSASLLAGVEHKVPWWSLDSVHIDALLTGIAQPLAGVIVAVLYQVNPVLLGLVAALITVLYRVVRRVQLVPVAEVDPKTGLHSYRYFEEQVNAELPRALSIRRPMAIVFGDVDHLWGINRAYGHSAGDQAIRQVAAIFQSVGGVSGVAARLGGEEFVLLLPGTDHQEAGFIAERIREEVERVRVPVGADQVFSLTISLGIAIAPHDGTTALDLIAAADAAMHRAKAQGRNRVAGVKAAPSPEPRRTNLAAAALPPAFVRAEQAKASPKEPAVAPQPHPLSHVLPGLITLAAAVLLAWSATSLQTGTRWGPLGVLMIVGAAAQVLKVRIYGEDGTPRSLSPSMLVTMGAGAYLGVAEAVLVNLAAGIVQVVTMKRHTPIARVVTNLGMAVVTAACGALPFVLVRSPGLASKYAVFGPLAIVAGASLYYLANVGLMVVLIALEKRQPVLAVWQKGMAWATPYYFSLTVGGGLTGYFQVLLGPTGTVAILALQYLLFRTFQQQASNMIAAVKTLQEARDLLAHAHRMEKKSLRELTEAISAIIDTRDANVYGHSRQVARYAAALAGELGITEEATLDRIRTGALLHDLGKVGIPEALLHKPGALTPAEYEIVKHHTIIGERILTEIESFADVAPLVGSHHERWDGTGYPRGAAGAEIPLGARILAVADTLDSILSDRPYSSARSLEIAVAELDRYAAQQFDPEVVAAVHRLVERMPPQFFQNSFEGEAGFPNTILDLITAVERSSA